jgi:hypothetical protein
MVAELQRIRRRTLIRPVPVLVLAALVTVLITRKFANKPIIVEAEVVIALTEGSMATAKTGIPVDQLRAYVTQVLLPDQRLLDLVEKYDLFRLRRKQGSEYALENMHDMYSVAIWKNSFAYYDDDDDNARRSARIGITVRDSDADRALDIARDLARIVIETAASLRQARADVLTTQVAMLRSATNDELDRVARDIASKTTAIEQARKRDQVELAGILRIDLHALQGDRRRLEERLSRIAASTENLAGDVAAAGLDMSLSIVDENRPERPTHSGLILVMVATVIGTGSLIGAAMVLGAFDSRVHEPDDVTRLGLPVLGHVPGFAGDNVGSMRTRSARTARVPSFQRWRFHQ